MIPLKHSKQKRITSATWRKSLAGKFRRRTNGPDFAGDLSVIALQQLGNAACKSTALLRQAQPPRQFSESCVGT